MTDGEKWRRIEAKMQTELDYSRNSLEKIGPERLQFIQGQIDILRMLLAFNEPRAPTEDAATDAHAIGGY